ncbi:MAG: hypothetical protein R3336_03685, partial [Phycisphaeraceae bacterium]|nr:hypothetical protein [Phycisphaeraceae bacterium]
MIPWRFVLGGLLLPAVTTAVGLFGLRRVNRTRSPAVVAIVAALAIAAGQWAGFEWPGVRPGPTWAWLGHLVLLAAVAEALVRLPRVGPALAVWLRLAVAITAVWVSMAPLIGRSVESHAAIGWVLGQGAFAAAVWTFLAESDDRRPDRPWPLLLALTAGGLAGLLILSNSARFAQLAVIVAISVGAALVPALIGRKEALRLSGLTGPAVIAHTALAVNGSWMTYGELPLIVWLLALLAPVAGARRWWPGQSGQTRLAWIIRSL